ncbi:MAG: hypothetical protein FWE56_05545 [Candidatus Bathyarchaeota archaeon]|nr:hypothetical protein [Candidatus Termiticorpusculum sp.]
MTTKNKMPPGVLERIFTNNPEAKILDCLMDFQDTDISKNEISKLSGVSFRHTLKVIPHLEKIGLIKHTRNVSLAHMYKYNTENPTAMLLQNFVHQQASDDIDRTLKEDQEEEKNPYTITINPANIHCLMHNCTYNTKKTCTTPHAQDQDICLTYKQDPTKTQPDDIDTLEPDQIYYDNPPTVFTNANPGDIITIHTDRQSTQHTILKKNPTNTEITVQKILGTTTCQIHTCPHNKQEKCTSPHKK